VRLLTYNIKHGGHGRIAALASVINACTPDLVLLQEATDPGNVERLAEATGMADWKAYGGQSLGFLSREPVAYSKWTRPRVSRHAFIEIVPAGELRLRAHAYATELATYSAPRSMAVMKEQFPREASVPLFEAARSATELMIESFGRPELAEGLASWNERRPPRFPPHR